MNDLEHPTMIVVLDVNDIKRAAPFWSAAPGFPTQRAITQFVVLRPDDPNDHRPHLILQQVPEAKVVKNRSHLDLHFPDREAARDRLLGLGAKLLQEQPNCIDDYCWYLMADPEGNEFCVAPGG